MSTPPRTLHLIGDSTMAEKSTAGGNPERGWGMALPHRTQPDVRVANHAKDGRSSKSFIDEGLWTPVRDALRPNDWLIVQFGHNDQKQDQPLRYTHPATTYRENLTRFAREANDQGAHVIFATSISRRRFSASGELEHTLGEYPVAKRQLARELGVPLVDLNEHTRLLLTTLGPQTSRQHFLHFAPGALELFPTGRTDDTHLSATGASAVAGLFVDDLFRQDIALRHWFVR